MTERKPLQISSNERTNTAWLKRLTFIPLILFFAPVFLQFTGCGELEQEVEFGQIQQAWSTDLGTNKGHHWITDKAFEILSSRGLLPHEMDTEEEQYLIHYGNAFADQTWLGRPENPNVEAHNHATRRYDSCQRRPSTEWKDRGYAEIGPTGLDIRIRVRVGWYGPLYFLGYCSNTSSSAMGFFFDIMDTSTEGELVDFSESFGQDNLYHYSYSDLKYLNDSNIGTNMYDVRFWPLSARIDFDKTDPYSKDLVRKLRGDRIVANVGFGATEYGSILYQLSRKFFEGSHAEPSIDELVPAGNHIPGWETGGAYGDKPFREVQLSFPSTYLGGMPFICDNPRPHQELDSCRNGNPTWPSWLPEEYFTGESEAEEFLAKLRVQKPGRSNRAALIYLGWALHMIQDLLMPHHASNWTGPAHRKVDRMGNNIPSDDYLAQGLDEIFGPESAPFDRFQICNTAGVTDTQIISNTLNWESVHPLFVDAMREAFYTRKERPSFSEIAPRLRRAVHDTAKLLLCAPPRTLSPALISVITSNLL